jgi:hypothetical protein
MSVTFAVLRDRVFSELGRCQCGQTLTRQDFTFDRLGRTIQVCKKCGPKLLATRVGGPVVTQNASKVHFLPPNSPTAPRCACGAPLRRHNAKRCFSCAADRKLEVARGFSRRKRAKRTLDYTTGTTESAV